MSVTECIRVWAARITRSFAGTWRAGRRDYLLKLEFVFIIMGTMSTVTSPLPLAEEGVPSRRAVPPAMTRCECAGVSFEEIARQIKAERLSLEDASRRTGCGGTCTACIPDLRRFLERS